MKQFLIFIFTFYSFNILAQEQTLYLNPESAISTNASQLFSTVNYIPLETTRESLFGRINKLIVTDKLFIVLEDRGEAILFFDKTGKFIHKYGDKKNRITDIQLNRTLNSIEIFTFQKGYEFSNIQRFILLNNPKADKRIFQAFTCNLKKENLFEFKPIPNFKFAGYNLKIVSPGKYLASQIFSDKSLPDSKDHELKLIENNKVTKKFFPYNTRKQPLYYDVVNSIGFFNTSNDSVVYFTRPYRYEIYRFDNNKITTKYKFVFPQSRSLPIDFFDRDFSATTAMELFKQNHQGAI